LDLPVVRWRAALLPSAASDRPPGAKSNTLLVPGLSNTINLCIIALMAEKISTFSEEEIAKKALKFHKQLNESIEHIVSQNKHRTPSQEQLILGNNKDFINIMGVGTGELHLVVGKTPVEIPGHPHRHLSLHHILHPMEAMHQNEAEDEEKGDPSEFEAWEAVIKVGDQPAFIYSSHHWQTGMIADDSGKQKKGIVINSPSGNIQINNVEAAEGIEELIQYTR
jgi:hypothetical protein